ncbi:MAG TPA: NUDIX hydrolase, partial [Rhodobiaceae bacterium]|nr:NUDIX hydrolase [Rhodobiaceae bacterium]
MRIDVMTSHETIKRTIRPRDAASLVLIDTQEDEPRILMGRRHSRMKFVPDAFVFPGGKLDAGDMSVRTATGFGHQTARMMENAAASRAKAQALAAAAIRETFEETGLIVAAPGDVGVVAGEGWEPFRERGIAL